MKLNKWTFVLLGGLLINIPLAIGFYFWQKNYNKDLTEIKSMLTDKYQIDYMANADYIPINSEYKLNAFVNDYGILIHDDSSQTAVEHNMRLINTIIEDVKGKKTVIHFPKGTFYIDDELLNINDKCLLKGSSNYSTTLMLKDSIPVLDHKFSNVVYFNIKN